MSQAAENVARECVEEAPKHGQRTGQYLFNNLRPDIAERIRGSLMDPFHKDFSEYELNEWLNEHIVFDMSGEMIGLFANDTILWEKE